MPKLEKKIKKSIKRAKENREETNFNDWVVMSNLNELKKAWSTI
jgi:hypothetical protein